MSVIRITLYDVMTEELIKIGGIVGIAATCAACPILTWFVGVGIVAIGASAAKK